MQDFGQGNVGDNKYLFSYLNSRAFLLSLVSRYSQRKVKGSLTLICGCYRRTPESSSTAALVDDKMPR